MNDEIIINHEAVEFHANEMADAASGFTTGVLPSSGGSTLTACENSSQSFKASQELFAALTRSLSKDAEMIRDIGNAFKENDSQIAGEMTI